MESLHLQMLEDETPENERIRMDPDHWYELNLTNSFLFFPAAEASCSGVSGVMSSSRSTPPSTLPPAR